MDRSNLFAASGIIWARDTNATIDLSLRIERKVRAVGNVDGSSRLKQPIKATVTRKSPYRVSRSRTRSRAVAIGRARVGPGLDGSVISRLRRSRARSVGPAR